MSYVLPSIVMNAGLSPEEIEIATGESPAVQSIRAQLAHQQYEAEHAKEYFLNQIGTFTTDQQLLGMIRDFADWSAKLALVNDRIERFGFRRRLGDK